MFSFQNRYYNRIEFKFILMKISKLDEYEFLMQEIGESYYKFKPFVEKISLFNCGFYFEEPEDHDAVFSTINSDLMIFTDAFEQIKTNWKVEFLLEDLIIPKQIILHSENGGKVVLYLRENQM